jgi:hypothetical protein
MHVAPASSALTFTDSSTGVTPPNGGQRLSRIGNMLNIAAVNLTQTATELRALPATTASYSQALFNAHSAASILTYVKEDVRSQPGLDAVDRGREAAFAVIQALLRPTAPQPSTQPAPFTPLPRSVIDGLVKNLVVAASAVSAAAQTENDPVQ